MGRIGLDVVLDIKNHYAEEFAHLSEGVRDLLRSGPMSMRANSASRRARASIHIALEFRVRRLSAPRDVGRDVLSGAGGTTGPRT